MRFKRIIIALLFVLPFFLSQAGMQRADASPRTFKYIFAFGDSMTDNGNTKRLEGFMPPLSHNFWRGHYSNGPVWVEYLSLFWLAYLRDYAYGYAQTGYEVAYPGLPRPIPGVLSQITAFIACGTRIPARSLFLVAAGSNDASFKPADVPDEALIATVACNLLTGVGMLADYGAKDILLFNEPDFGAMPEWSKEGRSDEGTAISMGINARLVEGLACLRKRYPCVNFYLYDMFGAMQSGEGNYRDYGFTNITDENPNSVATGGPIDWRGNGYFFWDDSHPSTWGHFILALKVAGFFAEQ